MSINLSLEQTEIAEFQKNVSHIIISRLNSGLKKLLSFIQGDYLKQAPGLLPGHHFQINLQSENEDFSPFRRDFFLSAYGEGWGEYAARLGDEMGIYKDPYERCGRIVQDLFMSVRLVVDTGMNYFQWPRQKAKKLMKKYLLVSDFEIETETLRYSTGIPAQALAYKIGSLKMWELRKKAEKALGSPNPPPVFSHEVTVKHKGTRRKKRYPNLTNEKFLGV